MSKNEQDVQKKKIVKNLEGQREHQRSKGYTRSKEGKISPKGAMQAKAAHRTKHVAMSWENKKVEKK